MLRKGSLLTFLFKTLSFSFLIIFFIYALTSAAESGRIKGVIQDAATDEPLPGANILLKGTGIGTASDLDGAFFFTGIPPGDYQLVIQYIGYEEKTIDISLAEGQTITQTIKLNFKTVEGEAVEVTAQAEGQMQAINQQFTSNTISNVVSEARIRELPDVNAAESIGRLPGVAIERSGGEATKIAIRGLSPKYNTVTVNGVRVPATGADDRSVDLSLISSNMLQGIEVKKAITPDMDADALGGTVDLKLKEAPQGLEFDLLAQGGYNQLQEYYGNYKFSGNISNRFYGGRLGLIGSFNVDEYDRSADKFAGSYRERSSLEGETQIVIQSLNLREESVIRGRTGASIVLDYRIPNGKITANSFYNRLHWDGLFRINRLSLENPSNRHFYDIEDRGGTTSIFTGAFGFEQNFNWFKYDATLARTASRSKNPGERTWHFVQEAGAFTQTEFPPKTDPRIIPQYATNDTFETALAEVYDWDTHREEDQTSVEFNIQVPFRFGNLINGRIKSGGKFRWLDRMNDVEQNGRNGIQYGNSNGPNEILESLNSARPEWGIEELVNEYGLLPIVLFLSNYNRSDFLNGDYPLGFTVDNSMMHQVSQILRDSLIYRRMAIGSLGDDYDGTENYKAGYVMAEFDIGRNIKLMPGIRYEYDRSEYHGHRFREVTINNIQGPPADLDTITSVRRHEFWLPMVHLQMSPSKWMKIRLARTETLTRPDFIQYAPITRINVYQTYIRAANSLLRPAHSVNYDASVSVFQDHIGLFTVNGFYKEIDDLIFQTRYSFKRGIPVPEGFNIPQKWLTNAAPDADLYINNPFKSTYKGLEFEWQTHFWYLPSVFKGLILNVNYTRIFSETQKQLYFTKEDSLIWPRPPVWTYKVVDSSRTARMPDQPAHIANITLGYDFKGFSARLSFLYQTDRVTFLDRRPELDNFSGAYARWDLSIRQKFGRGIEFFSNLSNLNNRADRNFRGEALEDPTYIEYYGFSTDVGLRYKF